MKTEKVMFKNSKGRKIVGELQIPDGEGPFPAVVICHGFKGGKHQEHMVRIAGDLTKEGFVTLRFDFTNNPGESDGDLQDITVTQEIDDLNHAIEFIKNLAYTSDQIGITGHSLGGMVCVLVASERNDVKCLVPLSAVFDFMGTKTFKKNIDIAKKQGCFTVESKTYNKEFRVNYSFYEDGLKYDMIAAANKIKCPTLVVHGDKDESVPLVQGKNLFNVLKCEKEIVIVKDAPHTYLKDPYLAEVSKVTVDWFKKHLK